MQAESSLASSLDEGDPRLARNWSNTRKWSIVVAISCVTFVTNMTLVICAPASIVIGDEFHTHNGFLLTFFITVPNLGQMFGPLYVGPMSERIGRRPICNLSNILFLICTLITGFSTSIGMIIGFRFLSGAVMASICLNPAIVGDMFPVKKRGAAMSITSLIPITGSAIGPIAGGYITQGLSWRWTFWLSTILMAVLSLVMAFVLKESYEPVVRRKAGKVSMTADEKDLPAQPSKYFLGWNMATVKAIAVLVVRPFTILLTSPVAVIMAFYLSLAYGYLSLLVASMASTFQEVYGFTEGQSGLTYIGLTIGSLCGAIMCRFTLDYFLIHGFSAFRPRSRRSAEGEEASLVPPRPENRLILILPGMAAFPVGLFMYGWSLQAGVHWIVPTIASGLCGFSLSSSTTPIMNYLVDIFGNRAASAVAAILPLRYLFGTFLPVAAPYMYSSLGLGWGNSLLAFLLLITSPIPFLVVVRPRWIPGASRPMPPAT